MKKLLLSLLSLSLLNVSMAQEVSPPDTSKTFKHRGFEFHFIFSRGEFSPEIKLNSLLQENGYPGIRNFTLLNYLGFSGNNLGFGGQYRIGGCVINGELIVNTYTRENERILKHSAISQNVLLSSLIT